MKNVHNVLARVKINAQNAKILWKSQISQMEVNAYVVMRYAKIYVLLAVKKENMWILV